jgi:hypothetical protein
MPQTLDQASTAHRIASADEAIAPREHGGEAVPSRVL